MAFSLFRAGFLHSTRLPKALNGSPSFLRRISTYLNPTEEEIISVSLDAIQASPLNIKSAKIAVDFVFGHPKAKTYRHLDRFRVMSRVLDGVCTYPQIDTKEVFSMRCLMRSACYLPENVKDLTREQVTSRVLEVIKIFPNVDLSKVNEDTNFTKDLGLDFIKRWDIVDGLRWMFRLHDIDPKEIFIGFNTVKQTVDYLCSHLHETWVHDENPRMSIHQDFIDNFRVKEYSYRIFQLDQPNAYKFDLHKL